MQFPQFAHFILVPLVAGRPQNYILRLFHFRVPKLYQVIERYQIHQLLSDVQTCCLRVLN